MASKKAAPDAAGALSVLADLIADRVVAKMGGAAPAEATAGKPASKSNGEAKDDPKELEKHGTAARKQLRDVYMREDLGADAAKKILAEVGAEEIGKIETVAELKKVTAAAKKVLKTKPPAKEGESADEPDFLK